MIFLKSWNRGINGIRFPACCKDCVPPKRCINCHATCPEYLAVKAKHDADTAAERAARRAESEADYVVFKLKKG